MKRKTLKTVILVAAGCLLLKTPPLFSQQSNFTLMPAPIAHPFFEPQRTDFKVAVDYFSLSGNDIEITGGGAHGIFRHAISEVIAIDGVLGLYGLSGETPGFALPFFFSTGFFTPVIEGKSDLSGIGLPMALNLEVQVVNKPGGSLILFGGPNIGFASLTLETPYHGESGATIAPSTTFTTDATVVIGGVQAGVQAGIRLGSFRLAPFFMGITQSGSASFTFDNGYRNTLSLQESGVVAIEPYFVTVTGVDIIYEPWNLSLGAMFQKTKTEASQQGFDITYFTLAWHFRKS